MAVAHIAFNDQLQHGRLLRRGVQMLEEAIDALKNTKDVLEQMRDGDGSQAAHYAYATTKFGTPSDAATKALYDELASGLGKLTTDAQVSSVRAAVSQLIAKLR